MDYLEGQTDRLVRSFRTGGETQEKGYSHRYVNTSEVERLMSKRLEQS